MNVRRKGFSLVEVLMVLAVTGVLSALIVTAVREARYHAWKTESVSNIRQLAIANQIYAADHERFAPWSNASDNIHWHGERKAGKFVGTGGYGYNATYIGGDPNLMDQAPAPGATRGSIQPWWTQGSPVSYVADPAEVVMFTSSAIMRGGGIVEVGNSVPYHLSPGGSFGEVSTPTVHFRFRGLVLVAWVDAHVTFEPPNDASTSHNVYGDNNTPYHVGWFGPIDWNGYWNPRFRQRVPY